jgi:hypothetical protein
MRDAVVSLLSWPLRVLDRRIARPLDAHVDDALEVCAHAGAPQLWPWNRGDLWFCRLHHIDLKRTAQ